MIDIIAMSIVIFTFQLPALWYAAQKEKEIQRLNTALLRVERPVAAAVAERPVQRPEPEPLTDEQKVQKRARSAMFRP